jgi:hypothetical protein
MARTTDDPVVTISSDHNFGVRKLVEFYSPQIASRRSFQYFNGDQWLPSGPRWLILHRCAESNTASPEPRQVVDGHLFRLEKMFDCAILSGWQWWCYRRIP